MRGSCFASVIEKKERQSRGPEHKLPYYREQRNVALVSRELFYGFGGIYARCNWQKHGKSRKGKQNEWRQEK